MTATLQDTISKGKNGCCILPGTYEIDRPLQIPKPENGVFLLTFLPGSLITLTNPSAGFLDLSLLPTHSLFRLSAQGSLFLVPNAFILPVTAPSPFALFTAQPACAFAFDPLVISAPLSAPAGLPSGIVWHSR